MAFLLENIAKFINDNPELSVKKEELMKKARNLTEDGSLMVGMTANMVLGDKWAEKFFRVLATDPEHFRIIRKRKSIVGDELGFEEVVPGLMVNKGSGITVSIPHPDPAFVINNPEGTAVLASGNSLLIFSDDEGAKHYMRDQDGSSYAVKEYTWEDLVDAFKRKFPDAIVDHKGEDGFYQTVPLRKGI